MTKYYKCAIIAIVRSFVSENVSGKERAHGPKADRRQGRKNGGDPAQCGVAKGLDCPAANKRQGLAFDPPEVVAMGD